MITLTWWELEELLDHLRDRPDIWMFDESSTTWLRTNKDGETCCAFRLRGPSNSGPYRQFQLIPIAFDWSEEDTENYLLRLCSQWTPYGVRMEQIKLLTEDDAIKMDPKLARQVSVALALIEQRPKDEKEDVEFSPIPEIQLDRASGFPEALLSEPARTYFLNGGGYVSFRSKAGMLRVDVSLPHPAGGYSGEGQLFGYVRPKNGHLTETVDLLFNPDKLIPLRPEVTLDETLLLRTPPESPSSPSPADPELPDALPGPGDEVRDVQSCDPEREAGDVPERSEE